MIENSFTHLEKRKIDCFGDFQGSAVELSFFFAERRCCGSEFRLETSFVPVKVGLSGGGRTAVELSNEVFL